MGPYAIWGCRRGYVQIGSAAYWHEQRVEEERRTRRDAWMKAARSMRWTVRATDRLTPSLLEVGEALQRLAVAMRMSPPSQPRFTDWTREDWSWI